MTALAPPATIAFLGLGMMGRPMAARLAGAGFTLRVFDISQKAVADLADYWRHCLGTTRHDDFVACRCVDACVA